MAVYEMDIAKGKRVSATEAAEILGVPRYAISRIDKRGDIIKRYKLGHKTHVYDLDSLYAFLDATLVKPIPTPAVARSSAVDRRVKDGNSDEGVSTLREFLRAKIVEMKKR